VKHLHAVKRPSSTFLGFPYHIVLARMLFALVLSWFSMAASAQNTPEVVRGIQWLTAQVQSDGSLANESASIGTRFQSRSETAQTLKLMAALPPSLASAIAADTDGNTEYMAKKIVTLAAAGQPAVAPLQKLMAYQNTDGGFGGAAGYASNPRDTAFALMAMHATGVTSAVAPATGYLKSAQQADGSWLLNQRADLYTSAAALRALRLYASSAQVSGNIALASNFLMSRQSLPGVWGSSPWLSAFVYQSVNDFIALEPTASAITGYLLAVQQADGSWEGDPYVTAVVLRALGAAKSGPLNPTRAVLQGKLYEGQTGLPLAGVTVTFTGPTAALVVTDASGKFTAPDLLPGAYQITFKLAGYGSITTTTTVAASQALDLGQVQLSKTNGAATGTVRGIVKQASTGLPLQGVTVTASVAGVASSSVTDGSGAYQIVNVPAGAVTLQAAKAGLSAASASGTIDAGGTLIYSPSLVASAATLQGVVTHGATGMPLAGVTLTLTGANQTSTVTDAQGAYRMSDLAAGVQTISAQLAGFDPAAGTGTLVRDGVMTFSPKLYPVSNTPDTSKSSTVQGTITHGATGEPLAGVTVTLSGTNAGSVVTDAQGWYSVAALDAGVQTVVASFAGFDSASMATTLAKNTVLNFSAKLYPVRDVEKSSAIIGTITNGATGLPMTGVKVTLSGAASRIAFTDAQGKFSLTDLAAGLYVITTERAGFDVASGSPVLAKNTTMVFSPKLYANGTAPENANKSSLSGMVVDAGTNAALPGVTIKVTDSGAVRTITSDAQGRFTVAGLSGATADTTYQLAGYDSTTVRIGLVPLDMLDLGQVRLRREKIAQLLPDLMIRSVSRTGAITDAQSLLVSGNITVKIGNAGSVAAPDGVRVLAFHDTNLNGVFDADVDQVLGNATGGASLAPGGSADVVIQVQGKLSFRDAPIHVWIDSVQAVTELLETNNLASSASAADVKPSIAAFKPELKWQWKGSTQFPRHKAVEMAPVVMRTTDDNGDGKIDQADTPNVAFMSFDWGNWGDEGIFRIVGGKDGNELAAISSPGGVRLSGWPSIASADIDGDGLVDFLVPAQDGRLVAMSNTGAFKWVANLPLNSGMYFGFGGPNIVDLDGEGKPSILFGPYVINNDGSLRWKAQSGNVGGQASIDFGSVAADLDGDGYPEVIVGGSAYDRNGKQLWNNTTVGDGSVAVGNFNDTPAPEVVVVSHGRLFLLNNAGAIIWGPVALPGGGNGGAPTIARFDGDSKPGIGVAGAGMYTVFRADGSVLWSATIQDHSSSRTGSTVFDFDGDGRAEVIYSDETKLHVFAAATGATVFEQPTTSSTAAEYPLVVDLNNDGHADLVVPASGSSEYTGVRAFRDVNNAWVNTRSIWNQFAYSISNINDDGSVPRKARDSWTEHNTYRLNTVLGVSVTAVPDPTASFIRINDHGGATPSTLIARLGNASALALPAGIKAAFYNGQAGGALLGTAQTTRALASGEFEDLSLTHAGSLAGIETITFVVDDDGTGKSALTDFDRSNNAVSRALSAFPRSLGVAVSTDRSVIGANENLLINATVANGGSLDGSALVRLAIQTVQGVEVAVLPQHQIAVAHGAQESVVSFWMSGVSLAGPYQVKAQLIDAAGQVYAETVTPFAITAGEKGLSSALTTNKASYLPGEIVQLKASLANGALNVPLSDLRFVVKVNNPDGSQRFDTAGSLVVLTQGTLKEYRYSLPLLTASSGLYNGTLVVTDAVGTVLSQSAARFAVGSSADSGTGLKGTISIANKQVLLGEPVRFNFSATNLGNSAVQNLPLKVSLLDPVTRTVVAAFPYVVSLNMAASYNDAHSWVTSGVVGRTFVAVLSADVGGRALTLAQDNFTLLAPPVSLSGTLTAMPKQVETGGSVALLRQVQNGVTPVTAAVVTLEIADAISGAKVYALSDTVDLAGGAQWHSGVNWKPTGIAGTRYVATLYAMAGGKRYPLGQDTFSLILSPVKLDVSQQRKNNGPVLVLVSCNDGESDAVYADGKPPACETQRSRTIDAALTQLGVSHTITTNELAFTRALRSGLYSTFWISGKEDKLHDDLPAEITEAVFSGAGLILDGVHDARNKALNTVAGVLYRGKIGEQDLPVNLNGPMFDGRRLGTIGRAQKPLLDGGTAQGAFDGSHPNAGGPAIVSNRYGNGHSVLFAFDLPASLEAQDDWLPELGKVLDAVMPVQAAQAVPGSVLRYKTNIANVGAAADVDVVSVLPTGAVYVDSTLNRLDWRFVLGAGESKDLYVSFRAPQTPGNHAFNTVVNTVSNGVRTPWGAPLSQVVAVNSASQTAVTVKSSLQALVISRVPDRKVRDRALTQLDTAMTSFKRNTAAGYATSIQGLLQVTDMLQGLAPVDTTAARLGVGRILLEAQWRWSTMQ
jgi:hypothetical protein